MTVMKNLGIPKRGSACLVIIDVQQRFRGAIFEFGKMSASVSKLAEAFRMLGIPIIITEQNPEKLGKTIPEITNELGEFKPVAKMHFSCCDEKDFMKALKATKAKDVILCGLETHVCVLKTALDLMKSGRNVYLVCDAVSSRKAMDSEVAIKRLVHSGVFLTTVESIIFQLIDKAGTEEFRKIFHLIK
ncbi:MAG: hydrolase [Candidatus Aenigmarchaeota archaeon]|nr:hydrolase [Candidatus Aenigmarchaeota archaeon]